MTEFERAMRDIQAAYRKREGLPPLASDEIPLSLRKPERTLAIVSAALETGRIAYLNDPEAGRKRYLQSLDEMHQEFIKARERKEREL